MANHGSNATIPKPDRQRKIAAAICEGFGNTSPSGELSDLLQFPHGMHVDRLVEWSGMSRPTFYRHFKNSRVLEEFLLNDLDESIRAGMDEAIDAQVAREPLIFVQACVLGALRGLDNSLLGGHVLSRHDQYTIRYLAVSDSQQIETIVGRISEIPQLDSITREEKDELADYLRDGMMSLLGPINDAFDADIPFHFADHREAFTNVYDMASAVLQRTLGESQVGR